MDQIRTILVVDDDPTVCDAVTSYLSQEEYRIVTASRWTEAIATLQEDRPDAVLLDLHLPTVQGGALLEFIRESDRRLPVVIISADNKPDEMARLGELGASGFIRKPFETDDLLVVLEQVLLVDLDLATVPVGTANAEVENVETDDTDQDTDQPSSDVVPGAGVHDLSTQPTASPLEPTTPAPRRRRRSSSGNKRGRTLRGSWVRKLRNFALIVAFFIAIAFLLYFMRGNFTTGFAGISF